MIIELHAHTAEGSPCALVPAAQVAREYHKKGFGALVITNHFDQTLEVRFESGCEDFLVFGVMPEFVHAHPELCSLSLPAAHGVTLRM